MKGYAMTGGEQLDAWIDRQGLQREFVAKNFRVYPSTLWRWTTNKIKPPPLMREEIEQFTKNNDRLQGGADYLPRDIWEGK